MTMDQRQSDVNKIVLSQYSSMIAMLLINRDDQNVIKRLPLLLGGIANLLPMLGVGKAKPCHKNSNF